LQLCFWFLNFYFDCFPLVSIPWCAFETGRTAANGKEAEAVWLDRLFASSCARQEVMPLEGAAKSEFDSARSEFSDSFNEKAVSFTRTWQNHLDLSLSK
jgi:hypothetical protein